MIDQYNTYEDFDKSSLLTRTRHNDTSDHEEYRRRLLQKIESDKQHGNSSFLNTIESLRLEQRHQMQQAERDYYNQKMMSSNDTGRHSVDNERHTMNEEIVTTKPPLPKSSKQLPSPVLLTEERARHRMYNRSMSANIVRRHDDEIAFCPHRTCTGNATTTIHDLTTEHMRKHIQNLWKEFELEDYLEEKKARRPTTAASWAGRVTVPEPFSLTNSMSMDNTHRKKCMQDMEAAKLRQAVEEEINLRQSFRANSVPAHVQIPLYEQLQEEKRMRSEEVRQMTRDYLSSITKPFSFEAREKAKQLLRRHSYSGGDYVQPSAQFKAKPLPNFYFQDRQQSEQMKEQTLYRSIKKDMRSKDLEIHPKLHHHRSHEVMKC